MRRTLRHLFCMLAILFTGAFTCGSAAQHANAPARVINRGKAADVDLSLAKRYGAAEKADVPLDSSRVELNGPSAAPMRSPLYVNLSQLRLTRYTTRDGAPSSASTIVQTADGMLWIASPTGLLNFDGVEFDSSVGDSLPNPTIQAAFPGVRDELWLGFTFGGAGRLDSGVLTTFPESDFPKGSIKQFAETTDGMFARSTTGVAWLSVGRWRALGPSDGYDGHKPRWIGRYAGTFWIVDGEGTYAFRPNTRHFEIVKGGMPETDQAPVPYRILSKSGNDYVAQSRLVDPSGAVWFVAPPNLGRYRWLVDRHPWVRGPTEFAPKSDLASSGDSLLLDREGSVWMTTNTGLIQFTPTKFTPLDLPPGTTRPTFAVGPDNAVWIGPEKPGVFVPGEAFRSLPQLGATVGCFAFDKTGGVWTVSNDAVRRVKGSEVDLYPAMEGQDWGQNCQGLVVSDAIGIWVSIAKAGIFKLDGTRWQPVGPEIGLPPGPAVRLFEDDRSRLWLTYPKNRIAVVDGTRTTTMSTEDGLAVGNVLGIYVRGAEVWAAGDVGVARQVNGRFVALHGRGNQAFRGASGILETVKGDLWINAASGVYRVEKAELDRAQEDHRYDVSYEHFDERDGLRTQSAQLRPGPSLQQAPDGTLWFGGQGSLASIHPDHILRNRVAPVVSVRDLSADGKAYPITLSIELPPHSSAVAVRYTAPMLTSPDRVSFRYRLLGDDDQWQDVGNRRTAYFTNLDPGDYRLEVKATNEDGVEARSAAVVQFRILPAVYQAWWFKIICAVGFAIACIVLGRLQLQRSTRKVRVLLDERHAERERIARDLHDTLLQDFQGISLHLQAWSGNPELPTNVRDQVFRTAMSAVESLKRGREKILLLRSGDGERQPFIEAIETVAKNIVEHSSTLFDLRAEGQPRILTDAAYEEIIAIVRECLRNGVNHANAKRILVRVHFGRQMLTVTVADNGSGLPNEKTSQHDLGEHWGLVGIGERARLIGAQFHIRNSSQGGTTAVLMVPSRRAYEKR